MVLLLINMKMLEVSIRILMLTFFLKKMKDLPLPDQLSTDEKKLMVIEHVLANEPVINIHFCRSRDKNSYMVYLIQKILSTVRPN